MAPKLNKLIRKIIEYANVERRGREGAEWMGGGKRKEAGVVIFDIRQIRMHNRKN